MQVLQTAKLRPPEVARALHCKREKLSPQSFSCLLGFSQPQSLMSCQKVLARPVGQSSIALQNFGNLPIKAVLLAMPAPRGCEDPSYG